MHELWVNVSVFRLAAAFDQTVFVVVAAAVVDAVVAAALTVVEFVEADAAAKQRL